MFILVPPQNNRRTKISKYVSSATVLIRVNKEFVFHTIYIISIENEHTQPVTFP